MQLYFSELEIHSYLQKKGYTFVVENVPKLWHRHGSAFQEVVNPVEFAVKGDYKETVEQVFTKELKAALLSI